MIMNNDGCSIFGLNNKFNQVCCGTTLEMVSVKDTCTHSTGLLCLCRYDAEYCSVPAGTWSDARQRHGQRHVHWWGCALHTRSMITLPVQKPQFFAVYHNHRYMSKDVISSHRKTFPCNLTTHLQMAVLHAGIAIQMYTISCKSCLQ